MCDWGNRNGWMVNRWKFSGTSDVICTGQGYVIVFVFNFITIVESNVSSLIKKRKKTLMLIFLEKFFKKISNEI